ncbi:glycosyltransferase family 39 protein [Candidatus Parcubacteria bacterium]|nr:glycosyltransferase family 39 protein [Candidatus Parcubacteria bacterium]
MSRIKSLWHTLPERPYMVIAGIIVSIFLISVNMAWLNPDSAYVIKTNPRIPILWQYNGDAAVEFLSAAYFPEYFRVDKTRTNRPGYPVIAKALGEVYGLIALPIHKLNPLQKGILGYMTMKLLVYFFAAAGLYQIVRRWASKNVALLSVVLTFFHPFAVRYSGTFHTSELQFITPIFFVWLWLKLGDSYSHKKNIFFSLLAGFMMLVKQNYAPYLAILLYSFFVKRKYKESVLSFIAHLVPLAIWLLALKFLHLPYYNHEAATNGDGIWILQLFVKNPLEVLGVLFSTTKDWLAMIAGYFTIFAFLAPLAFSIPELRNTFTKELQAFLFILMGANWLQFLAAKSLAPYLTSDLAIFIFPLSAYLIYAFIERRNLKRFIPVFAGLYLLVGLISIIHFPWVHPFNQQGITNPDRVKLLEEGRLVPRQ